MVTKRCKNQPKLVKTENKSQWDCICQFQWYVSSRTTKFKAQGTFWKRGRKACKGWRKRTCAVRLCVLFYPVWSWIHEISTVWPEHWQYQLTCWCEYGGISRGPNPRWRAAGYDWSAGRERTSLFRGEHPILSSQSKKLWVRLNGLRRLYWYVYMFIYNMYALCKNNEENT